MFRPKRPLKSKNQNTEQDSDGLAKKDPGCVLGPITDTGVYAEEYGSGFTAKGLEKTYKTREEAQTAASLLPMSLKRKIVVKPRPKEPFRTPTGKLMVPAGTFVYVYRRLGADGKPAGWFKYHLKKERTFQEHHQVTTMNRGLLRIMAVKLLSNKQWITFHTEEEDYPLIAFSAFTTDFPLGGTVGVHLLGTQPGDAFPFRTPLKYPPHGNTFERLFTEQKSAFLFKEGFKAGFDSTKKQLDNK